MNYLKNSRRHEENKGILLGLKGFLYGDGTGRLLGWVVKRDLAMHVYLSYFSHSVYMERISLPGRFSSRPGKAESRFAERAKAG